MSLNNVCAIIFGKMLWNIITIVLNFWRETFPRQSFRLKLGMPNQVAKSLKNLDSVLKNKIWKKVGTLYQLWVQLWQRWCTLTIHTYAIAVCLKWNIKKINLYASIHVKFHLQTASHILMHHLCLKNKHLPLIESSSNSSIDKGARWLILWGQLDAISLKGTHTLEKVAQTFFLS